MLAGQDPTKFGECSPREIVGTIKAMRLRDARAAWLAAEYMRFAYHQPNDMPEMPSAKPEARVNSQVKQEIERIQLQVKLEMDARKAKHGR